MEFRQNRNSNFSPKVRGIMVGLLAGGYKHHQIAQLLDCNPRTVYRWESKYLAGGIDALADHRIHNTSPHCTNFLDDEAIVEEARRHPFRSATAIINNSGLNVSSSTCRRRLNYHGFVSRIAARKPSLLPNHIDQRIQYAINYLGWQEEWNNVIWSDEKCFSTASNGGIRVWRPIESRLEPAYVVPDNYSNRRTLMFWGCMCATGPMAIHEVSSRMNAEEYEEIIETVMLPAARQFFPDRQYPTLIYMHDNSAVHSAIRIRNWFRAHPQINILPHPPKSPDLNPIENIWSWMEKQKPREPLRSEYELRQHVHHLWDELRTKDDLIHNVVNSMHRRLQDVIARGGYWIKY